MRRQPLERKLGKGLAGVLATVMLGAPALAQEAPPAPSLAASVAHPIPWDAIAAPVRERMRRVIEQPTLSAHGPIEVFRGRMDLYQWLLDHPDRGVLAWRRLGSKCAEVSDRGNGRFGWTDGQGSDVHWDVVFRSPLLRIWYAEGSAKPGPLLPAVSVQAVAIIRCNQGRDSFGHTLIQQQGDLYLHTDSKAVALAAELLGHSAPQLTYQVVSQMQLFYSALIWYVDRHPEQTELLFAAGWPQNTPAALELRKLLAEPERRPGT